MKKILFLSLLACNMLLSQNGITSYAMPTGYSSTQTASKSAIVADNAGNLWVGFRSGPLNTKPIQEMHVMKY